MAGNCSSVDTLLCFVSSYICACNMCQSLAMKAAHFIYCICVCARAAFILNCVNNGHSMHSAFGGTCWLYYWSVGAHTPCALHKLHASKPSFSCFALWQHNAHFWNRTLACLLADHKLETQEHFGKAKLDTVDRPVLWIMPSVFCITLWRRGLGQQGHSGLLCTKADRFDHLPTRDLVPNLRHSTLALKDEEYNCFLFDECKGLTIT